MLPSFRRSSALLVCTRRGGALLFMHLRAFCFRLCVFVPLSFSLFVFVICLFLPLCCCFLFCFLAILLSCSFPFVRWFSCLVLSFLSLVAYCLSYLITTIIIIIYNILISFVCACVRTHVHKDSVKQGTKIGRPKKAALHVILKNNQI